MENETVTQCSICGDSVLGMGNNADPVNSGLCCDRCNNRVVIPARLRQMANKKQNGE